MQGLMKQGSREQQSLKINMSWPQSLVESSQLGNICTFRCWPATKRELTPAIEFVLGFKPSEEPLMRTYVCVAEWLRRH